MFFFFKQKTAYERRISDWSSDVCSSDLHNPCADSTSTFPNCEAQALVHRDRSDQLYPERDVIAWHDHLGAFRQAHFARHIGRAEVELGREVCEERRVAVAFVFRAHIDLGVERSEEHTTELQSIMRISYAIIYLKKQN